MFHLGHVEHDERLLFELVVALEKHGRLGQYVVVGPFHPPIHDTTVVVVTVEVELGLARLVAIVVELNATVEGRQEDRIVVGRVVRVRPRVGHGELGLGLEGQKAGVVNPHLVVLVAHERETERQVHEARADVLVARRQRVVVVMSVRIQIVRPWELF